MAPLRSFWQCRRKLLAGGLLLFANSLAFAALTNVNITATNFSPSLVKIDVNDQVKWTWVSPFHSTTSDDSLWDSGVQNTGFVFTNTFTAAGSYPYKCVIHFFPGTVTVEAHSLTNVNIATNSFEPPVVNINVNDSVMWTWISDFHNTKSDTALWDSGFHNNGFVFTNKFTSAGNFPYTCTVHGFAGTVSVQLPTGPPSLLSEPRFVAPSLFQFNYSAGTGLSYVVSRSADLANWVPLSTNVAGSSSVFFQDNNATNAFGAYRVYQLLNP